MIVQRKDARWWYALNGAARHALLRGANPLARYPLINEYPKSGGSWLSQMLGAALDLPNPRLRLPMLRSSIMHGHYANPRGMRDVVLVWRDGRDVTVSQYHHIFSTNDFASKKGQQAAAQMLGSDDTSDVAANLPRFIELAATGQLRPPFGWSQFYEPWLEAGAVNATTSYEAMLADAGGELHRIQSALGGERTVDQCAEIAERFSFRRQSGREPGSENSQSFLRKGIAGDWRNVFTREAAQAFEHYHGAMLRRFGYEANAGWVEQCPQQR